MPAPNNHHTITPEVLHTKIGDRVVIRNSLVAVLSAAVLAACSSGTAQTSYKKPANYQPSNVARSSNHLIPVPASPRTGLKFLDVHMVPFTEASGHISSVSVRVGPSPVKGKPRRTPIVRFDGATAERVAFSLRTRRDDGSVYHMAHQMARSVYCKTGTVSPNNGITRYSNPADIQKIVAASKAAGGLDTVPAGVRGTAVPAVRFRQSGTPSWDVSLKCS